MTLRKRQGTVNRKRKHQIALCEELALEEAMDLSQDGVRNEEAVDLSQDLVRNKEAMDLSQV
jgi:hypothetical protein